MKKILPICLCRDKFLVVSRICLVHGEDFELKSKVSKWKHNSMRHIAPFSPLICRFQSEFLLIFQFSEFPCMFAIFAAESSVISNFFCISPACSTFDQSIIGLFPKFSNWLMKTFPSNLKRAFSLRHFLLFLSIFKFSFPLELKSSARERIQRRDSLHRIAAQNLIKFNSLCWPMMASERMEPVLCSSWLFFFFVFFRLMQLEFFYTQVDFFALKLSKKKSC